MSEQHTSLDVHYQKAMRDFCVTNAEHLGIATFASSIAGKLDANLPEIR